MKIKLENKVITKTSSPYFIAEISGNHNGKIDNAIEIIKQAKHAGADAVKLQTYTADTMTLNCKNSDFLITEGLWKGYSLYELYKIAHTPWDWHKRLFKVAKDIDITIFSTPFDKTSINFLEELNTPFYKIASFEITDIDLLIEVANTKKPIILSTGMANENEIKKAIEILENNGSKDIILLHCISGYPTPLNESNINTIPFLKKKFNKIIGLSDHTKSSIASMMACAVGAKVIEKHIILDRSDGGVDSDFSLEPSEFKLMIENCKQAFNCLGNPGFDIKPSEKLNLKFRRSIYASKDIRSGEHLSEDNIKVVRPGHGLDPSQYRKLLNGYKAINKIKFGTPINWGLLEN